jgi:hypothetical protein
MQAREDDDTAPSDLNWTAAYQFARQAPGRLPHLGRPRPDLPRFVQIPARHVFLDEFLYFHFPARFKNAYSQIVQIE